MSNCPLKPSQYLRWLVEFGDLPIVVNLSAQFCHRVSISEPEFTTFVLS